MITREFFEFILRQIKTNRREDVDLQECDLTFEQLQELCEALKTNTSVKFLDLSRLKLANKIDAKGALIIAEALEHNKSIQALRLDDNCIGVEGAKVIANVLKDNKTLHELYLGSNKITDEGAAALANALVSNTSLKILDLGFNQIGKDGNTLGAKAIAKALIHNKNLKNLSLRCNLLTNGAKSIAQSLKRNTTLQELRLDFCNITDEGAEVIAKALKDNKTLRGLNLDRNNLSRDSGQAFVDALIKNTTLQSLSLLGTAAWDQHREQIRIAIEINRETLDLVSLIEMNKKTLDLVSQIEINKETLDLLSQIIPSQVPEAEPIRSHPVSSMSAMPSRMPQNEQVPQNTISSSSSCSPAAPVPQTPLLFTPASTAANLGPTQVQNLAKKIIISSGTQNVQELKGFDEILTQVKTHKIKAIDLRKENLTVEQLQKLCEALKTNTSVESLNISGIYNAANKIDNTFALIIAAALEHNKSIQSLRLEGNCIGVEGAKAIAEVLKDNKTLHELYLGTNNITDEGADALANALTSNTVLKRLDLGFNQIGKYENTRGIEAIAKALIQNKNLRNLSLRRNHIGPNGAKSIAQSLKRNTTLVELDLGFCQIKDEGAQAIAEVLKDNKALRTLNLDHNTFTPTAGLAFEQALAHNRTLRILSLLSNTLGEYKQRINHVLQNRDRQSHQSPLADLLITTAKQKYHEKFPEKLSPEEEKNLQEILSQHAEKMQRNDYKVENIEASSERWKKIILKRQGDGVIAEQHRSALYSAITQAETECMMKQKSAPRAVSYILPWW